MKIDMQLIKDLVAANAPASAILAYLERQEAKAVPRKEKDRVRKRAEKVRKVAETQTPQAEIVETQRARLFREGKQVLLSLGISKTRAGALITQWLSVANDDEARILETIKTAQRLAVHDAPAWILAQLRGSGNGRQKPSLTEIAFDLAGEAERKERQAGIGR